MGHIWVNVACWVVGFILLVLLFAWQLIKWDARHSVSTAPKEKMYSCDKHGLFLEKYAITLADDIIAQYPDGTEKKQPLLYCPFCYEEKIQQAKKA